MSALAAGLRRRLEGRPAPVFVAIDGWSGSGKTTLGEALGAELGAPVVHVDDLVAGWDGLSGSVERLVAEVLAPLAAGRAAAWRRWDWAAGAWGTAIDTQRPAPLLVVEGCGAGAAPARPYLAALVWLDVDDATRAERLRERDDWPIYRPWVEMWSAQERALRSGDDPSAFADVVVAGGGLRWREERSEV